MYFYLAIGFLIILYILFLIWLFRKRPVDLSVKDLRIPKRKFVLLGLQWCQENLETTTHQYDLKIHYYPNRKFGGKFQSYNKQIIIYLYPDLRLEDLTDIIIHEYIHHIQFSNTSTEQDYNKELTKVGYWMNPYEVQARENAAKNRTQCLEWILKNNQLF